MKNLFILILCLLILSLPLWAQEEAERNKFDMQKNSPQELRVISSENIIVQPVQQRKEASSKETKEVISYVGERDEANYTLGANDSIEIKVQSHPELSGTFSVNSEGNIQYQFIGEVSIGGMKRSAAEDKIRKAVSKYVNDPKLYLKIVEYHSKAIYVMGQVTRPGKYYMRSETLLVREAIIEAGLPLTDSAMHRARLITPAKNGEATAKIVDLNALLYKGDLQYNLEMHSGDQLYVPSTQEEYLQAKSENGLDLKHANITKSDSEDVRYTLGPDDVIEITVQRHPELSGKYPVNLEGKIQTDIIGDIEVTGLTKKELERKIGNLLSSNNVEVSDISVTILDYRSKVYYVIGEVSHPGKFFMRKDSIPVREAIVEAGLPTYAAAMRKCRLITPSKERKAITKNIDLYSLLYYGNLRKNLEMHPGDFLYVPSTVMAKLFRVIAPIAEPVSSAAATQSGVGTLSTLPTTVSSRTK